MKTPYNLKAKFVDYETKTETYVWENNRGVRLELSLQEVTERDEHGLPKKKIVSAKRFLSKPLKFVKGA